MYRYIHTHIHAQHQVHLTRTIGLISRICLGARMQGTRRSVPTCCGREFPRWCMCALCWRVHINSDMKTTHCFELCVICYVMIYFCGLMYATRKCPNMLRERILKVMYICIMFVSACTQRYEIDALFRIVCYMLCDNIFLWIDVCGLMYATRTGPNMLRERPKVMYICIMLACAYKQQARENV
jgi:hypothetical protein